jgi:tellurite methyltransferase
MSLEGNNQIRHSEDMEPAAFLIENVGLLPNGRVLDVAMGGGRNSLYLAERGFDVVGVDISSAAIGQALKNASKRGLAIKAEVGDLEKSYSIPHQSYDVIICFNYLQRSLFSALKVGLKKGGMLVYETFIIDQAELFGHPRNPDFLLKHNELLNLFRDFRVLRYREGVFDNSRAVAGLVAQKE